MPDQSVIDALFPQDLPEPADCRRHYPPRGLPEGAEVTRFAPSPTGVLHIGGLYTAAVSHALARQTGGTHLLRVEDTDQSREVAGARSRSSVSSARSASPPTRAPPPGSRPRAPARGARTSSRNGARSI